MRRSLKPQPAASCSQVVGSRPRSAMAALRRLRRGLPPTRPAPSPIAALAGLLRRRSAIAPRPTASPSTTDAQRHVPYYSALFRRRRVAAPLCRCPAASGRLPVRTCPREPIRWTTLSLALTSIPSKSKSVSLSVPVPMPMPMSVSMSMTVSPTAMPRPWLSPTLARPTGRPMVPAAARRRSLSAEAVAAMTPASFSQPPWSAVRRHLPGWRASKWTARRRRSP